MDSKVHLQQVILIELHKFYWEKLNRDILNTRSETYDFVRAELKKQGHWKAKPRGKAIKENLKRQSTGADIHLKKGQQVTQYQGYDETQFND